MMSANSLAAAAWVSAEMAIPEPVPSWKPFPAAPGPARKPATAAAAASSCTACPLAAAAEAASAGAGGATAGLLVARTALKPPAGLVSSLAAAAGAAWGALAAAAFGSAPAAAGAACCCAWKVDDEGWAECAARGALNGLAYLDGTAGLRKEGWWARGWYAEVTLAMLWRCCRGAGACQAAAGLGAASSAARACC
jgi:hypothetical protein